MQTMISDKLIPIREAAEMLGVSLDTLRRWDKKGIFPAIKSPGGHRSYSLEQVESHQRDLFSIAKNWASSLEGKDPEDEWYCANSVVFQARLMRMERNLLEKEAELPYASLIVSAVGEIGNNSFDHNLGNWRDVPGVFYAYDMRKRQVVLADRGQGVLTTLRRVKPGLETDEDALRVAFTEVISGRAPEARGNGLKLVKMIVERYPLSIDFYSGTGKVSLRHGRGMQVAKSGFLVGGCLAIVVF